jgi:hypothetical protein
MSIFSFFSKTASSQYAQDNGVNGIQKKDMRQDETSNSRQTMPSKEIPEHVFVEYDKPKPTAPLERREPLQETNNLAVLYLYLGQNLEKRGYEDALMNPDTSAMQEQIQYTRNELNLLISKVNNYYAGFMRQIDFHIDTRKRNGMVETVDELITHKATIADEMKIVASIEESARSGTGITENLFLSYRRGFTNGFAAITYNTILSRKT